MPQIPSFNDLAKSLDPMLPAADYDKIREKFFVDNVVPHVRNRAGLPALWTEFKKRTERQALLSPSERLMTQVIRGANAAGKEMVDTVRGLAELRPQLKAGLEIMDERERQLDQIAAREGMGDASKTIGSIVGMGAAAAPLFAVSGPAASAIASKAFTNARTISAAGRILKGTLGTAAFEVARENEGSRLIAGVRGAALGVAGEMLLTLPAFYRARSVAGVTPHTMGAALEKAGFKADHAREVTKHFFESGKLPSGLEDFEQARFKQVVKGLSTDPNKLARSIMRGEVVNPVADQATREYIEAQTAGARAEGRPSAWFEETPTVKGVHATLYTSAGKPVLLEIKRGYEDDAFVTISRILEQGGSLDKFQWNGEEAFRAQRFMSRIAAKHEIKYDANLFVSRTPSSTAAEAAAETTTKVKAKTELQVAQEEFLKRKGKTLPSQEPPSVQADAPPSRAWQPYEEWYKALTPEQAAEFDLQTEWVSTAVDKGTLSFRNANELQTMLGFSRTKTARVIERMRIERAKKGLAEIEGMNASFDQIVGEIKAGADEVVPKAKAAPISAKQVSVVGEDSWEQALQQRDVELAGDVSKSTILDVPVRKGQMTWQQAIDRIQQTQPRFSIRDLHNFVNKGQDELVSIDAAREAYKRWLESVDFVQARKLNAQGVPAEVIGGQTRVPVHNVEIPEAPPEPIALGTDISIAGEEAKAKAITQAEKTARAATGAMPKMNRPAAENLLRSFGVDPANADVDAAMWLGEEELTRLYETVQQQRKVGVSVTQTMSDANKAREPFKQVGELTTRQGHGSELLTELGFNPDEYATAMIPHPKQGHVRIVVPKEVLQRMNLGDLNGVTFESWQAGLKELGVSADELVRLGTPDSPLIVLRQGTGKSTLYHEGIHSGLVNTGFDLISFIPRTIKGTAMKLSFNLGLGNNIKAPLNHLANEAFTYAAQAVRLGDTELFEKLVAMDTSREKVLEFVNGTSRSLLEATATKLDSPGVRIFQRRLQDLVRRSDDAVFHNAKEAFDNAGQTLDFDPVANTWTLYSEEGPQIFRSLNEAWDSALENRMSDHAADPTFWAQVQGLRGPVTNGPPPRKRLPLGEQPFFGPGHRAGWLSVSGWFRPNLDWVSSVDKRIQSRAALGKPFPLYDTVRSVDQAVRKGQLFLDTYTKRFGDILKHWSHEKQSTLFELMTHNEDKWIGLQSHFRLSNEELRSAADMVKVIKDFNNESGVNLFNYLREYYPQLKRAAWQPDGVRGWGILKKSSKQGFWENKVTSKELDPSDAHMGRFLKWSIRQGYEQKFTGAPLKALEKLIDTKNKEGQYMLGSMRWPLSNYAKYVKGVPDTTQQALNQLVESFQGTLSGAFARINKMMPAEMQLPTEFNIAQSWINRFMLLNYTAGLALRPAVTLRDGLQVFMTGLPVIGPKAFFRGAAHTFAPGGYDRARRAGALLGKHSVGELYGDIFDELPMTAKGKMKWAEEKAQALLGPSRWGNNLARSIVYNGVYDDALAAVRGYQKGIIKNHQDFVTESHLWFAHDQAATQFVARAIKGESAESLANEIALEIVEATQWPYRRGAQPAMLRTGLGRVFGQYGTWPMNYMEFMSKLGKKHATHPKQAMTAAGTWLGTQIFASTMMENVLGVDASRWLWFSPAGYTGGPHLELVRDLMTATGSDERAESARARILRYPLNFIPAGIELRSIITAMESDDGLTPDNVKRIMGFKPLEEIDRDQDWSEWLLEESGVTANPYLR